MSSIPHVLDDITPGWLTAALRNNGHPRQERVESISAERIGQGRGFAGSIARLTVRYTGDSDTPSSLIAKLPSIDPHIRRYAIEDGMYRRETMFYRELATRSAVAVPGCYFADLDADTGDFILLLEDLGGLRGGSEIAGCSLDEAELVVRNLARLHARWWNEELITGLDWLAGEDDSSATFGALQGLYRDAWSRSGDTLAAIFPPDTFAIAERFGQGLAAVLEASTSGPQTLNHGDCHLGNLFFGDDQVVFTDWQNVMLTSPALDIAYFIQGSLSSETRRTHERELLNTYRSTLAENGVTSYPSEKLIEDYRRGLLVSLIPSVLSVANLDMVTPESLEMTKTIGARMIAIADWDCGDLIPA
ncbi:MAG: phosphotransferase [Dehalococcoidia bacterium]|nr:phosphotransferase [Dehalococcoidia bacterium]